MSKFCKKCGQKLPSTAMNFFSLNKSHEFEDGDYCDKCSKMRVEESRK